MNHYSTAATRTALFLSLSSFVMVNAFVIPSKISSSIKNYHQTKNASSTSKTALNYQTHDNNNMISKTKQPFGDASDLFPSNIHEFPSFIYANAKHQIDTLKPSSSSSTTEAPLQEYHKLLQTHEHLLLHKGPLNPSTLQLLQKIIKSINTHKLQTKYNQPTKRRQSSSSSPSIQQRQTTYISLKNTLESILSRKKSMSHTSKSLLELYKHDLPIFQTLALLYIELNMIKEAKELYEQVIYEIQVVSLGKNHELTIQTLHDIGNLYSLNNDVTDDTAGGYETARKYYLNAYTLCKKHLGMVHEITISVLHSLCNLYLSSLSSLSTDDKKKKKNEIMSYRISNKCLNIIVSSGNMNVITPQTAFMTLHNLALYHQHHSNDEATTTTITTTQSLPSMHSSSYLSSLSSSPTVKNNPTIHQNKSLKLYQKCLQQQMQHLGPTHHDTLLTMHNLSTLLYTLRQYNLGINLCQQCFIQRKLKLGLNHYDTLLSLSNLGMLYEGNGELEKAKVIYGICWELQRESLGDDHVDSILTKDGLDRLKDVVIVVGKEESSGSKDESLTSATDTASSSETRMIGDGGVRKTIPMMDHVVTDKVQVPQSQPQQQRSSGGKRKVKVSSWGVSEKVVNPVRRNHDNYREE